MTIRLILLLLLTVGFSKEYTYKTVSASTVSDRLNVFVPQNIDIRFDNALGSSSFLLYLGQTLFSVSAILDDDQADSLVSLIDKYKKWNVKASKNKVSLSKILGTVPVKAIGIYSVGKWTFSKVDHLTLAFLTLDEKTSKYVMSIGIPNIDEFYDFEALILNYKQAMSLRLHLKNKDIGRKEMLKQIDVESDFE